MSDTQTPPLQLPCPTCKKNIEWSHAYPARPFCSARCKLIDLGEWASESNAIAGEAVDPMLLDDPMLLNGAMDRREH